MRIRKVERMLKRFLGSDLWIVGIEMFEDVLESFIRLLEEIKKIFVRPE